MTERTEPAAVAAPDPVGDDAVRELLQSIVDVARAILGAQVGSVFVLDEAQDELVCQAVSGRGAAFLVGRRVPADRGIAGWVAISGESRVVDDLRRDATFEWSPAESTGYDPDALMAVPLIHGGRVIGVLEVLDPAPQSRSGLAELDLLSLVAHQAAAALRIAVDHGADRLAADAPPPDTRRTEVARLVTELEHLLREIPDH